MEQNSTLASSLTLFSACLVVICFSTSCSSWRRFSASVASGTSLFARTVVTSKLSFGLACSSPSFSSSRSLSSLIDRKCPSLFNLSCSSSALLFLMGTYSSSLFKAARLLDDAAIFIVVRTCLREVLLFVQQRGRLRVPVDDNASAL